MTVNNRSLIRRIELVSMVSKYNGKKHPSLILKSCLLFFYDQNKINLFTNYCIYFFFCMSKNLRNGKNVQHFHLRWSLFAIFKVPYRKLLNNSGYNFCIFMMYDTKSAFAIFMFWRLEMNQLNYMYKIKYSFTNLKILVRSIYVLKKPGAIHNGQ